ncbi:MAG: hypothetical protein DYH13_05755 [Alphaproteobacteria bacterium PRO2]|nr:hypothetical protein [Alphaproteobacteria bacterium PRO2]
MAASPESVERLVSIMKEMGFETGPGHTRGVVDPAFKQAFDPALKALLRIGIDEKASNAPFTPGVKAELLKSIEKNKADSLKMGLLEAYAIDQDFTKLAPNPFGKPIPVIIAPKDTIRQNLVKAGFEGRLLEPKNVGGVLKFFENAHQYVDDVEAADIHLKTIGVASPAPEVKQEPPAKRSEPVKPVVSITPSSSETTAPAVTPTGGVSLARPSELTSAATATGYVERTIVHRDVHHRDVRERGAASKATGSGSSVSGNMLSPEEATKIVEETLVKLGKGINEHIGETKAKSGLGGSLLFEISEIPTLAKADGVFDRDSEKALQAVLKTMQRDIGLTDDEIYNYTPAVGQKIVGAIQKLGDKFKKNTNEDEKKKFSDEITTLVGSLNTLHDAKKFTHEKLYEGPPVKLTGLGAWIIQGIFDFIGAKFPRAKGLMDGLLVNLTGYSFSELMPGSKHSSELAQIRNEVDHLDPQEQIKALYLKAAQGADGKTSQELKSVVMDGVQKLMGYSDPEQGKAFTQAVSSAFDEAEKQRASATPADAAKAFADTLKTKWGDLPAPSGSSVPHQRPGIEISIDSKLQDFEKNLGLKPHSMAETMNKMIALGVEQNGGKEWPVFFKDGNSRYVMGVTKDNVLTAVPVTDQDILALNRAINNVPGADLKSPALEMLTGPRYAHIPLTDIRNRLSADKVQFFPDVEKQVAREYKMWQEHVKEEAMRPVIDAQVAQMERDRREAYAMRGFDTKTRGPISPGGDGSMALKVSDEVLGQYYALSNPVLLKDDYGGRGRVRVLFCDDFNGVRDEKGRALSSQELYLKKHDSFKTLDITAEYDRFEGEFKKFRETLPSNMDKHTALDRYRTHLNDNGIDLGAKYPKMASIVFNSDLQRGGVNYAYLMNNGKPDVITLFKHIEGTASGMQRGGSYAPEEVGFFAGIGRSITNLFNSKSSETKPTPPDWVIDQPKISSKNPLYTEENGGIYEERTRKKFPEAFKDDPPAAVVAKADPAITGPVSTDAPPSSKQRAADLFPAAAAEMADREKEYMRQDPATPAPRVNTGMSP